MRSPLIPRTRRHFCWTYCKPGEIVREKDLRRHYCSYLHDTLFPWSLSTGGSGEVFCLLIIRIAITKVSLLGLHAWLCSLVLSFLYSPQDVFLLNVIKRPPLLAVSSLINVPAVRHRFQQKKLTYGISRLSYYIIRERVLERACANSAQRSGFVILGLESWPSGGHTFGHVPWGPTERLFLWTQVLASSPSAACNSKSLFSTSQLKALCSDMLNYPQAILQ